MPSFCNQAHTQLHTHSPAHGFNIAFPELVHFEQVLTLEGWSSEQMYFFLDAIGYPLTVTFYVSLILFGSLFALNLLTAIISAKVCHHIPSF